MSWQFDYDRFINSSFVSDKTSTRRLRRLTLPRDAFAIEPPAGVARYDHATLDVSVLRTLCTQAKKYRDTPLLQLDGLLPLRDLLLDAPVGEGAVYNM